MTSRGTRRTVRAVAIGALALAGASGALGAIVSACGGDATSGERVGLHTRIAADPEIHGPFVASSGWKVTLSKAAVAVGALYYFDSAPAFVRRDAPSPPRVRLAQWLGLGTALAHPGHYASGSALGEVRTPTSVDLFAAPATLADGDGVGGTYRSGRFVLPASPVGPAAAELAGHVAVAEGVAEKADGSASPAIHFRVSADYDDVVEEATDGHVDGCAFDPEADVTSDGTVTITVVPSVWFELVDFAGVAPGSAEAPTEIPRGDLAHRAFVLGVVQLSAYRFTYAAK